MVNLLVSQASNREWALPSLSGRGTGVVCYPCWQCFFRDHVYSELLSLSAPQFLSSLRKSFWCKWWSRLHGWKSPIMVNTSSCITDFLVGWGFFPPFPPLLWFPVLTMCCAPVMWPQLWVPEACGHHPLFRPAYAEGPEVLGLPATASCSCSPVPIPPRALAEDFDIFIS